jgi:hypothetical protein
MRKIFFLLFLSLAFVACDEKAQIEIPNSEPKLVAASFIEANQDTLEVFLSWTLPIYYNVDGELKSEAGAEVSLSKEGQTFPCYYDATKERYIALVLGFQGGDEISLNVNYKNEKQLKATTILSPAPQYDINYLGLKHVNEMDWDEYYHQIEFTCRNAEASNFYRMLFHVYISNPNMQGYTSEYFLEDYSLHQLTPNQKITLLLSDYNLYDANTVVDSIRYYVYGLNEDYYRYHTTLWNNQYNDVFVEPTIVYSNVEGGLGILSGYHRTSGVF